MDVVQRSWQYFLTLERDFLEMTAFVDVDPRNFHVFSDRFRSLLILLGAEIDATCKFVCKQANPDSNARSIDRYRSEISGRFPLVYLTQVHIRRYDIIFAPWMSWFEKTSPTWWRAYNDVKHDRHEHRAQANLLNVIQALSGLFSLHIFVRRLASLSFPDSTLFTWSTIDWVADEQEARIQIEQLITSV